MPLTVSHVDVLPLLHTLNRTTAAQARSLLRLSTGLRINRAADDPSGIVAIRGLETSLVASQAALENLQRSNAMLDTAGSALGEVGKLLNEIQAMVQQAASPGALSGTEIAAHQAQIDAAIDAIDRIVGSTAFNGRRLLDGSLSIDTQGVSSAVRDLFVFGRAADRRS
jgi:flagellin